MVRSRFSSLNSTKRVWLFASAQDSRRFHCHIRTRELLIIEGYHKRHNQKTMSSPTLHRRKTKTAWSKSDDVRLCRSFVLATQSGEDTEHVRNMWTRVQTHYSALAAAENPAAIPRAGGALQTHWSSFIRPDSFFFMSLLLTVSA